jgi:hypothetical protein
MDRLNQIVRREVQAYAVPSYNSRTFAVLDDEAGVYVVLSVTNITTPERVVPVVMARVIADTVIIEADNTNKPLVDALLQQGIHRESIILAYEGEFSGAGLEQPTR